MKNYTLHELVHRVIGPCTPTFDHGEDMDRRLPNLEELISLTDKLLGDIDSIGRAYASRDEASARSIGQRAKQYIKELEWSLGEE